MNTEICKVLSTLGWSSNVNDYPTAYGSLNNSHESYLLFYPIRHRKYVSVRTCFRLSVEHPDAWGADSIISRSFDSTKPRWQQSVFAWHAMAVFKLAEIRAKHAERDAIKKQIQQAREKSWSELCKGSKAMAQICQPYDSNGKGEVTEITTNFRHSTYAVSAPIHFLTLAEKADKFRKLSEFLVAEGWVSLNNP